MSAKKAFDLLVLGGGSGGVRASRVAAGYGARVGLIEKQAHHGAPGYSAIGGTCVNVGCVPKKLMMYGSQFPSLLELSQFYGWNNSGAFREAVQQAPRPDWKDFLRRKNAEISRLNEVYTNMLGNAGVEIITGCGTLQSENSIRVGDETYTADKILIAVGAWPHAPPIPGIEHSVSSNELFYLDSLPRRVTVVGGGYIAVEFASILNGYGCEVTQLVRSGLLRSFDHDLSAGLATQLVQSGIDMKIGWQPTEISKHTDGSMNVSIISSSKATAMIETDMVLNATGRVPNVSNIGLENAGVETDEQGAIIVDDNSMTTAPSGNVFAVGDVTNRMNLTPVALDEGHCFADTYFGGKPRKPDHSNIPAAVFSSPPMAAVGLTEKEAIEQFSDISVYKTTFRPMLHTLAVNTRFYQEQTLMKLVVDTETDKVLGAHMLGPDAAEILQGLAVAITAGATKAHFDSTIGIHPSAAEEFVTMRQIHSRFIDGVKQDCLCNSRLPFSAV